MYCTAALGVEYIEAAPAVSVAARAPTVLSAFRQPLMCVEQFRCLEVLSGQGSLLWHIMKCDVAILKDLCQRRGTHAYVRPRDIEQCEPVSGGLSGRRPAQFKCETHGFHSPGVSVTVDSLDPFQRR